jgi:hypothetical protein
MKLLLVIVGLLLSISGLCQKYEVGLLKTGSAIKVLEGQIIVTDSTVTSIFDGKETTLKVVKRVGYTIHVTDGTSESKYVISNGSGRMHGFSYDRAITFYPATQQANVPVSTFYCSIKRD